MKKLFFFLFITYSFFHGFLSHAYELPYLATGFSSFIDGGPLRPSPGFYWTQFAQYYTTHRFLDADGNLLNRVPSPKVRASALVGLFVYQFDARIFGAQPGIDMAIPVVTTNTISRPNALAITKTLRGLGDTTFGLYLQWDPLEYNGRPVFVHRLECYVSFPTGKKIDSPQVISPGNGFYYLNPYWSGTVYLTKNFGFSWRLNYVWSAENRVTKTKAGDAVFINYTIEWGVPDYYYVGLSGYFLQQIIDTKICGKKIPDSKERVFAAGPGALYYFSPNDVLLANIYFEALVRNRTQGINFVLKFVKEF